MPESFSKVVEMNGSEPDEYALMTPAPTVKRRKAEGGAKLVDEMAVGPEAHSKWMASSLGQETKLPDNRGTRKERQADATDKSTATPGAPNRQEVETKLADTGGTKEQQQADARVASTEQSTVEVERDIISPGTPGAPDRGSQDAKAKLPEVTLERQRDLEQMGGKWIEEEQLTESIGWRVDGRKAADAEGVSIWPPGGPKQFRDDFVLLSDCWAFHDASCDHATLPHASFRLSFSSSMALNSLQDPTEVFPNRTPEHCDLRGSRTLAPECLSDLEQEPEWSWRIQWPPEELVERSLGGAIGVAAGAWCFW